MISIKRNSKGELVEATGVRKRASSKYVPNQIEHFKISRSKFNDFLSCQRCFYLDRVEGLVPPSTPGWTLNETTDLLLKREFDICREKQIPHKIFRKFGINHVVPFQHKDIDKWRDSLHHGLGCRFHDTNIVLHGGVDDIWFDKNTDELIVVDYKSQATDRPVDARRYLAGWYRQSYKIQLDFYAYLLINMGYSVSPTGYFYVCNADRTADLFDGKLSFNETLVPYEWSCDWIEEKLWEMITVLNSHTLPDSNPSCENCAYARQRTSVVAG